MGKRKFNIGNFLKDAGHKIEHAVTHPETIVATVASVSPAVIVAKELPGIVKTVAPIAGEVVKEVGRDLKGAVKGVTSFGSGLFNGMIPYVVGGVVLYFVITSRR